MLRYRYSVVKGRLFERAAYVQLPKAVAYIVLSSRDHASYKKDSGALEDVLKNTFVYLEPKSVQKQD